MEFKPVKREVAIQYDVEGEPFFQFEGERISLSDVIRTHNNPWIDDHYPDYIHGMFQSGYKCFYVSLDDSADCVSIYMEVIKECAES